MSKTLLFIILWLATTAVPGAAGSGKTWNFDRAKPGTIPGDFYSATGSWKVRADATAPSKPNVLAQLAKNSRDTFNLALIVGSSYRNLDISVKMRAIGGTVNQGGGIVLRAKDSRNYTVVSYNPLDGNFRVYKVVNNAPLELANVNVMNTPGWHTLRVVMTGDQIICYFDGTKYIDRRDATYLQAGQIGLWTKADAQTYFDDLRVTTK
ncbi:MAG TPA: family 16 glycoside hydrolase [Geobacteraceae bacterium]|nr:family 16 glycoside hydrolase [Geobacteraceae bacterium]